jgi:hypothetical protein
MAAGRGHGGMMAAAILFRRVASGLSLAAAHGPAQRADRLSAGFYHGLSAGGTGTKPHDQP